MTTEGRTEAAAVDQAIADVREALEYPRSSWSMQGHYLGTKLVPEEKVEAALAALRVLADAVEEAQHERAVAIEAAMQYRKERDRLQAANERARIQGRSPEDADKYFKQRNEQADRAQTLRDALEQAQRVTTLISDDGPPFLLDGEPLTGAAEVELLSLHDLVSHALATPEETT